MHLLRHKDPKPQPLVNVASVHWRREHPRLKGKRFNAKGEFLHATGPKIVIDQREVERVKAAQAKAAGLPPVVDTKGFDPASFNPVGSKLLLVRPAPIKEVDGITLEEKHWRWPSWFIAVRVNANSQFQPGDRLVFGSKSKPKHLKIEGGYYIGRETAVVGMVEGE